MQPVTRPPLPVQAQLRPAEKAHRVQTPDTLRPPPSKRAMIIRC